MRLHRRLSLLAALAALAAGTILVSCQTLSGAGGSSAEFTRLKQAVSEDRARLRQAAAEPSPERVPAALDAVSARFDEIWSKAPGMNLLDREHLAIQLASGRRIIDTAKQWAANSDIEAVRSETQRLDAVLGEVETLLDRSTKATAEPAPAGS